MNDVFAGWVNLSCALRKGERHSVEKHILSACVHSSTFATVDLCGITQSNSGPQGQQGTFFSRSVSRALNDAESILKASSDFLLFNFCQEWT